MRNKLKSVIAVLLASVLLCGGAMPTNDRKPGLTEKDKQVESKAAESKTTELEEGEIFRFDDLPYERPDVDTFCEKADELIDALEQGAGYRRVVALLNELFTMYYHAETMGTIADIRNCLDLSDKYYAAEYAACMSIRAEIGQIMEDVYFACGASRYGPRLERAFFGPGFLEEYCLESKKTVTDEYIALTEEENELIARYRSLQTDPVIALNGREVPLMEALYGAGSDREYEKICRAFYEKYNKAFGELYLEMLDVRKAQAEELGYGSYAGMMYDIGYDRDFSLEDGAAFLESVRKWILPLYERYADDALEAELLEDYVSEKELRRALEAVAYGLGSEAAEAYDFMRRHELYDLAMDDKKAEMSFQVYLDDYEAPYLFVNPYGDLSDYITVTHEFGHYVEAYISYGVYRSTDVSEIFSQAMQFLGLGELQDSLGRKKLGNLRLLNLYDILDSFVSQAAYAEFEKQAFELEEPNVERLNALYGEILAKYGMESQYDGMDWIDITHFFEQPFYVISYPISACCAMEIYERELEETGAGFDSYLRLVDAEKIGIVGAAEEAGLQNPITDERVRETAVFLEKQFAA